MARVKFNAGEIDQNFQIEEGIRRTLETEPVASVDQSVIESCYELEDDDGKIMAGSADEKCQAIAARLDLEFSVRDDLDVRFASSQTVMVDLDRKESLGY